MSLRSKGYDYFNEILKCVPPPGGSVSVCEEFERPGMDGQSR